MHVVRAFAALVFVSVMPGLGGCGGSEAPDNPGTTLTQQVGFIADDDEEAACALILPAIPDVFARENDATSCETTVGAIAAKVTDAETYRSMKPTGLKITGVTATISGYCRHGWTNADGSQTTLHWAPNNLGEITSLSRGT
jgi:hypothetical protein